MASEPPENEVRSKMYMSHLKDKMSPEMYAELHRFVAEVRAGESVDIDRVRMGTGSNADYAIVGGQYFGACERGERIYCIYADHGTKCVRTTATARDLHKAFKLAQEQK